MTTLSRTVAERVTDALRARILSGGYPPGARLRQDAVASELGVSRIPLREALNHLQAEGLVQGEAHRGFVVRRASVREAREVFELRLQLEPQAVAEGARVARAADRVSQAMLLERLDALAGKGDIVQAGEIERAFLLGLIAPEQRPLTGEMLSRLQGASHRYLNLAEPGGLEGTAAEHSLLLKAWTADGAEEAGRIAAARIQRVRDRVLAALDS